MKSLSYDDYEEAVERADFFRRQFDELARCRRVRPWPMWIMVAVLATTELLRWWMR